MPNRFLIFCLLILLTPTAIFMWSLLYAALSRKTRSPSYRTKLFVIDIHDVSKALSLNMIGLAYICNPDDYPLLTALGVPNLIRLTHVHAGEVVILAPQAERKNYGN